MISRRTFIALLGTGLFATPRRVAAQPAIPRIAYVGRTGKGSPQYTAFLEGLRELDYVPDGNVAIDVRFSETAEQFEQFAAEMTAKHVDAIFASNPYALGAFIALTKTVPLVGVDLEDRKSVV